MSFILYPQKNQNAHFNQSAYNEIEHKSGEIENSSVLPKQIKTHRVQIVENNFPLTSEKIKMKQCQLTFKPQSFKNLKQQDDDNSTFDTQNPKTPQITIPLSFFQQLVQQALQNKQTKVHLNQEYQEHQPIDSSLKLYYELIGQLHMQSKFHQNEAQLQDPLVEFLIMSQQKFVAGQNNQKNDMYLQFQRWASQLKLSTVDDIIMASHSFLKYQMTREEQIIQQFKSYYHSLLLEYYQKHAFVDVMHSDVDDKEKCLLKIGEILTKLVKPPEYFYFNK